MTTERRLIWASTTPLQLDARLFHFGRILLVHHLFWKAKAMENGSLENHLPPRSIQSVSFEGGRLTQPFSEIPFEIVFCTFLHVVSVPYHECAMVPLVPEVFSSRVLIWCWSGAHLHVEKCREQWQEVVKSQLFMMIIISSLIFEHSWIKNPRIGNSKI